MRYFCRVAYNGAGYGGWQRQPHNSSIQEQLDRTAAIILHEPVSFTGAGRTDAGVHAAAQGAHFDYDSALDFRRFTHSMNALLPNDIAISNVRAVAPSFHARYSAVRRRYRYAIRPIKSPLHTGLCWVVNYPVDWTKIAGQVALLEGEHDFTTFRASGCGSSSAWCTVFETTLSVSAEQVFFTIEANRFIYKMVRSIVGTLVDIGRGACAGSLHDILTSCDRTQAGVTAPSCGLVLEDVVYKEDA